MIKCEICGKVANLTKNYRPMAPAIDEAVLAHLAEVHGLETRQMYEQLSHTSEASWECPDCLGIDHEEYFKRMTEIWIGQQVAVN